MLVTCPQCGCRHHVPPSPTQRRREQVQQLAKDHAASEIADALGVSTATVYRDLKSLGITRRKQRPTTWSHAWDDVDWEAKTDTMIAEELGTAVAQVSITRRRQNRPEGPDGRKPKTWTPAVVAWKRERGLLPKGRF